MKWILFWVIHAYSAVIIRELPGQLGNNFFRLAAGVSLAIDHHSSICLPGFYQNHSATFFPYGNCLSAQEYFRTVFDRISQQVEAVPTANKKVTYAANSFPIPYKDGIELNGYFQNENFFKNNKQIIRNLFAITPSIESYIKNTFPFLDGPKTVGIHVRTYYSDWKQDGSFNWFPPDLEFYKKAVELFDKDSLFIVCSDHIDWCKKHFPSHFVFIESHDFIYDFFLLTKCKGLIISGSTFGWWAAYLNEHATCKIVSRHPFMDVYYESHSKNFYNADWIQIDMPEVRPPIPIFN